MNVDSTMRRSARNYSVPPLGGIAFSTAFEGAYHPVGSRSKQSAA